MATTYLAPDPIQSTQLIPGGAVPANGGQLFFYLAGTNTKSTVYKDNAAAVAHTNPIVLDSGGNIPSGGEVWFASGVTYKVVFAPATDTDPPVSPYWTKDNLAGMNDVSATASEWISGTTPTFVSTTSFTLAGDQTATYTVGRRVRTVNSGGTIYSTIVSSVFGALTTVKVRNDSGVLDSGLSAVSYGIMAATNVSTPQASYNVQPQIGGRLTLVAGQPVTSSDIASTILFYTPYLGNTVDIYDGSANWNRYTFAEMSTVVPVATGVRDVFIYNTSGALAFTTLPWTNNTTRATAISSVAGMPTLTVDLSKLYLGTYWATGGAIPDTNSSRALWNYWNRVPKQFDTQSTSGSWFMNSSAAGTSRIANNDSSNSIVFVTGAQGVSVEANVHLQWNPNNNSHNQYSYSIGFSLDNGTTISQNGHCGAQNVNSTFSGTYILNAFQNASYRGISVPGYHNLYLTEYMTPGSGAISMTINSAGTVRSGITGKLLG